MSAAHVITVI